MKLLMAANWKMHKTGQEAAAVLTELGAALAGTSEDREVVVFPPFTALVAAAGACAEYPQIALGGQNCYSAEFGAFTGEISPAMLLAAGCAWVLTGHSERRALLGESDAFVGKKTAFALQCGLKVVLCVGESLQERDGGRLREVLFRQLEAGLADIPASTDVGRFAVAYEPVWAIGTGRTAGSAEIIESHGLIRSFLEKKYGENGAGIRILYGGSVKPENTGEIIRLENVNGVLVGGASLQAESFARIVRA